MPRIASAACRASSVATRNCSATSCLRALPQVLRRLPSSLGLLPGGLAALPLFLADLPLLFSRPLLLSGPSAEVFGLAPALFRLLAKLLCGHPMILCRPACPGVSGGRLWRTVVGLAWHGGLLGRQKLLKSGSAAYSPLR